MDLQNYELKNAAIRERFETLKKNDPEKLKQRLNLSWSNWGFGMEALAVSAKRLAAAVTPVALLGSLRYSSFNMTIIVP